PTPSWIGAPLLGQIQTTIQKDMAPARRIAQKCAHLAILDLARRAAVLSFHSHRVAPLFQKASLIDHTDPFFIPKLLDDEALQHTTCPLCFPLTLIQQSLQPIGSWLADRFRYLPAVL